MVGNHLIFEDEPIFWRTFDAHSASIGKIRFAQFDTHAQLVRILVLHWEGIDTELRLQNAMSRDISIDTETQSCNETSDGN